MVLEYINLFPESKYLRCKKRPDFDHKCGGFVSLLILFIIFTLLVVKLIECFSYDTVFFKESTRVDTVPVSSTISTEQANPDVAPYMLAFRVENKCPSNTTITAKEIGVSSTNGYDNAIPLEKCTRNHFSNIPGLTFSDQTLGYMLCLPLNSKFRLQGSRYVTDQYKTITVQAVCTCGNNCGALKLYYIDTYVNPTNEDPFVSSLQSHVFDLNHFTVNDFRIVLDQNFITTDSSIIPFRNSETTQVSTSLNKISKDQQQTISGLPFRQTTLSFYRSSLTRVVNRNYLKLIDVLSYVGGFFPALFAFFFFIKYFSYYYYESTFSFLHFKCSQTKYVGIQMYLKRIVYWILYKIGYPPNWKIARKQVEINELTNKMLDINYLYKRIEFLEAAISSLLSDHQLKGVYLSQVTLRSAERQFNKHILRDRLVKYLQNKAEIDRQKRLEQEERLRKIQARSIILKPQISKQAADSNRNLCEQEMIDLPKIRASPNKMVEEKEAKDQIPRKMKIEVSRGVEELESEDQRSPLHPRERNWYLINRQVEMIELADKLDLDDAVVIAELGNDLKRLLREAKEGEDPVSRRIVENIDDWLRYELNVAIEDLERLKKTQIDNQEEIEREEYKQQ